MLSPNSIQVNDPGICNDDHHLTMDHKAIHFALQISKPEREKRTISFRPMKCLNKGAFSRDLASNLILHCSNPDDPVESYNTALRSAIDNHAPKQTKTVIIRPNTEWYNEDMLRLKREKRKLERRWRNTGNHVHKHIFQAKCREYNALMAQRKKTYYRSKVRECEGDSKALSRITSKLIGSNIDVVLPEHQAVKDLAEEFNSFFVEKIIKIRSNISLPSNTPQDYSALCEDRIFNGIHLSSFTQVSCFEVQKILKSMPSKSCDLDPLPTELLKENAGVILPHMTSIINESLASGSFPTLLKKAIVRPKIKKPGLDKNELKNYRPVSNIPLLAKILEKIVAKQLIAHLELNELQDVFQSAYRCHHSTETALLNVQSSILRAMDRGSCVILLMNDLSAAFDTIDHAVLIERLRESFGIEAKALEWLQSYLQDRSQQVQIGDFISIEQKLQYGVPQGSVLGPLLYCLYTRPVGRIFTHHGMSYHCYADDSQAYTVLDTAGQWLDTSAAIQACMKDLEAWMAGNKLKLNQEKFEYIVFHPHNMEFNPDNFILSLDNFTHTPSHSVKNLGVVFDEKLTMENQINAVARSCRNQLRSIGKIRRYLDDQTCKTLVNALVTSRLDYGNALLYGTPDGRLKKLQLLQNSAARLVTRTGIREHITPVLKNLHWLPVKFRIQYKILVLCHKSLQENAPRYMVVTPRQPGRALREATQHRLEVPQARTVRYGERCIDFAMAHEWNALPLDLRRESVSTAAFKKDLKTFLFRRCFNI